MNFDVSFVVSLILTNVQMTKSRSKLEEQLSINFLSVMFKFNEGHIIRDKFLFGGRGF